MSILATLDHHAVIGGFVIAAFVIGGYFLLGFAGRPSRLERQLAAAAIEDAWVRVQAKSSDDEGAAS